LSSRHPYYAWIFAFPGCKLSDETIIAAGSKALMLSGQFLAILSAALFGVSPVLCKMLIGEMSPALLAGLLYLGSGIGLQLSSHRYVSPTELNMAPPPK
jgi:hypothetical protein